MSLVTGSWITCGRSRALRCSFVPFSYSTIGVYAGTGEMYQSAPSAANAVSCLNFAYVCPEPVLAKHIGGYAKHDPKEAFSAPFENACPPRALQKW
eukprot:COSAG02_NODE_6616_length_3456_cov_1.631516_2_plen_96_part_00